MKNCSPNYTEPKERKMNKKNRNKIKRLKIRSIKSIFKIISETPHLRYVISKFTFQINVYMLIQLGLNNLK